MTGRPPGAFGNGPFASEANSKLLKRKALCLSRRISTFPKLFSKKYDATSFGSWDGDASGAKRGEEGAAPVRQKARFNAAERLTRVESLRRIRPERAACREKAATGRRSQPFNASVRAATGGECERSRRSSRSSWSVDVNSGRRLIVRKRKPPPSTCSRRRGLRKRFCQCVSARTPVACRRPSELRGRSSVLGPSYRQRSSRSRLPSASELQLDRDSPCDSTRPGPGRLVRC